MCWSGHRYRDYEERRFEREPARPPGDVRASDADRQRVIDQLRVHTADGRLTLDEFEARVSETWAASTYGDLRAVLRDLPAVDRAQHRTHGRSPSRRPGIPVPLLIAALVVVGSMLMDHFAWWLIPVGLFAFGGCGGHREHHADERSSRRDETLISA